MEKIGWTLATSSRLKSQRMVDYTSISCVAVSPDIPSRIQADSNDCSEENGPLIQVLPLSVVQRIASGEIIRGVSCAMRELVENSVDAGATRITVQLESSTRTLIVSDNGTGIPANQIARAAFCNATSKLRRISDLDSVSTLGFRGQGLWAVSECAKNGFELSSRHARAPVGTIMPEERIIPMAPGTVVRAAGLTRWGKISQVRDWLETMALARKDVSYRFIVDDRDRWTFRAVDTAKDAVSQLMQRPPADVRESSCSLSDDRGSINVAVGVPGVLVAKSTKWMTVAVNGRVVKLPTVAAAAKDALRLGHGKYPVVFIDCQLDPKLVDWNVLPDKSEVQLRGDTIMRDICGAVLKATKDALRWSPSGTEHNEDNSSLFEMVAAAGNARIAGSDADEGDDRFTVGFSEYKVVSQLLNTYILVESATGVTLIEQHVADERVLYEKYIKSWKNNFKVLEEPLVLPNALPGDAVFNLVSLGFDADEGQVYSIPGIWGKLEKTIILSNILAVISNAGRGFEHHTVESACAKLACDAAVRNGTQLTRPRMKKMVEELSRCDDARTCPHGRRIIVPLSAGSLAALFGRRADGGIRGNNTSAPVLPRIGTLPDEGG